MLNIERKTEGKNLVLALTGRLDTTQNDKDAMRRGRHRTDSQEGRK